MRGLTGLFRIVYWLFILMIIVFMIIGLRYRDVNFMFLSFLSVFMSYFTSLFSIYNKNKNKKDGEDGE